MTSGRCIFQGEFGEVLIPDILTFLDMIGKTGTLELTRPSETKHIYWERGEIVFADSSLEAERIGEHLERNGWIGPDALAEAKQGANSDAELIRALVRKGAVDPAILPRAVKLLVLDIVYSLFEWRDGGFAFLLTPEPYTEKVILRTSVSNTIMEGTRRLDEWQRIRETFPSDDTYPVPPASPPDAIVKLPTVEQEVLDKVDGRRTVSEIVRLVDHDQFTVLNALLTLLNAGLISTSQARPAPAAASATTASDGLPGDQREAARRIMEAFNNIFAGIQERIAGVKGAAGVEQFAATIQKGSFQKSDLFSGLQFGNDGRLPVDTVVTNLVGIAADERLGRLKGTLDRLLAQQVLQLDNSYPPEEKKAVSELIATEKAKITTV